MQTAIQFLGISNRDKAAKRYPFSAKHSRIAGVGRFPVVQRCRVPWTVRLWNTRAEAIEDARRPCGVVRCRYDHTVEDEL
jgi:hypothetical protein